MPSPCPVCSKINPAEANYCYYDGRPLSTARQQGPLQVGSLPFPTAFYFSDGQACANFNQLALACDNRWEEARSLLAEGIWPAFFGGIGRLDLAAAAKQAAGDPDRDRGLSQLLEQLPADPDCLRPPKVAVQSAKENLGLIAPGVDRRFELVIVNQGMLMLRGTVSSNCDWLVFGDRSGPAQKLFQTRNFYTIAVCVLGGKLRAGLMPLQGEIAIDTNGGTLAVPVHADIPIRPFPQGTYTNNVLAGARSPREVAAKAKQFPNEAALLFELGAVKAWYASNGWMYPIEGTQGSGKGAVQQFFEALGLTKPPHLEINTAFLTFKARIGERRWSIVRLRTREAKPVYAEARSNQDWVILGPIQYWGNMVTITLEIVVPPRPGETLRAEVTIQGNGKQQFLVPVSLTVETENVPVSNAGLAAMPAVLVPTQDGPATRWWRCFPLIAAGVLVAFFLLLICSCLLVIGASMLR
jgi:hypothetical protein